MNPNDIFPRRNLPGEAEEWGRVIETRIVEIERAALATKGSVKGLNRTTASSLQELSRQVTDLEALYNSIPKPAQASNNTSGFALGGGWNNVLATSITVPEGVTTVDLIAIGSGHLVSNSTGSSVASSSRLSFAGVGESPSVQGAWFTGFGDYRTVMMPTYSWRASVTPGSTITVYFQINPSDPAAYGPNGNSYAVLSLLATFTG